MPWVRLVGEKIFCAVGNGLNINLPLFSLNLVRRPVDGWELIVYCRRQRDGTRVPMAALPQHRLHVYKPRFYWGFERFYRFTNGLHCSLQITYIDWISLFEIRPGVGDPATGFWP